MAGGMFILFRNSKFILHQTDQAVIANNSTFLSSVMNHDKSPLKSINLTEFLKFHSSTSLQTTSSFEQDFKAWSGSSWGTWHRSHNWLTVMVRLSRAVLVGMALRQALHIRFFTFGGTFIDHIIFQSCLLLFVWAYGMAKSSASSLRYLYPDLQV